MHLCAPPRSFWLALTFALTLSGCGASNELYDLDGDGSLDSEDCAPQDPLSYPGAPDSFGDAIDQDCDGTDGIDRDGDGFPSNTDLSEEFRALYDCDDSNPDVHPDVLDLIGDQLDSNCDGHDGVDADGDGYASSEFGGTDCNDLMASMYPDAADPVDDDGIDSNCDGIDGEDADGDGEPSEDSGGADCNDLNPLNFPQNEEVCDGNDNDCNGLADFPVGELDQDGDEVSPCEGDCNDDVSTVYPDAAEICDGLDNDCDGTLSDGENGEVDEVTDSDGDGAALCSDCDDQNEFRFPGNLEFCDGQDNDCDDIPNADALGEVDGDHDGQYSCDDCDDSDPSIHPMQWDDPSDEDDIDCNGTTGTGLGTSAGLILSGESPGDLFGSRVAAAGDVDGDGISDVLVTAPSSSTSGYRAGTTYLFLGSTLQSWLGSPAKSWTSGLADVRFFGESPEDQSGISADSVMDLDGDGDAEVLIGAWRADSGNKTYAGKTYLFLSSTIQLGLSVGITTWSLTEADAIFLGEEAGDESGISVTGSGDVDSDGKGDILIGAWNNDEGVSNENHPVNAGKAYLVLGSTVSDGINSNDPSDSTWDLSDSDASFVGWGAGDNLGRSVAFAGNVDGQGGDDILLGAPGNDSGLGNNRGKAYFMLSSTVTAEPNGSTWDFEATLPDLSFVGEQANSFLGQSLAPAGDVDGDGRDDILIGSPDFGQGPFNRGKTYLIFGASIESAINDSTFAGGENPSQWRFGDGVGESPPDVAFEGDFDEASIPSNIEERSGFAVASAGNVDGQGGDDILIGAFGNTEGGRDAGKTYLMLDGTIAPNGAPPPVDSEWDFAGLASNSPLGSFPDASFVGEQAGDYSGYSVTGVGDVNSDGFADFMIGAHHNNIGLQAGLAYLVLGRPPASSTP